MKNNKACLRRQGFAPIAIVLIIVAVLVVGGGLYYSSKNTNPVYEEKNDGINPLYQGQDQVINPPTQNPPTEVVQNCTLTQPQAESVVLSTWGGCTPDSCGSVTVTLHNNVGQCVVTAIYGQLRDDSTGSQKKEAIATYQNPNWVLGQPTVTWACQPNRGHSDYSTVLCF